MSRDLSHHRTFYKMDKLLEDNLPQNPLQLFEAWFEQAEAEPTIRETNTMTVTTLELDGYPRSRVVLLKYFDTDGFTFFTNYNSQKGQAIKAYPKICLSFFWPQLERQVIIKGQAKMCSAQLSDTYFNSRPKASQLAALASNQSEKISNREALEHKFKTLQAKYKNKPIKRPEHWGGFTLQPVAFEFWQGRENRMHDRIQYQLQTNLNWIIQRLQP